MKKNLEKTLSAIQVGITLIAIISGAMIGKLSAEAGIPLLEYLGVTEHWSEHWSESVSTIAFVSLVTYLTVVLGELVPKSIAARYPSAVVFFLCRSIRLLNTVFYPVIRILELSTLASLKILSHLGLKLGSEDLGDADEGLAIHKLSRKHREYVLNLVNLQGTQLREVLLPWKAVTKINGKMSRDEIRDVVVRSGHTRVPVVDEGKVTGLLNAKEFLAQDIGDWRQLIHPIIQAPESAHPLDVFRTMQTKRSHMSVVQSSKTKDPIGIVTIEDILEEVVGEIYDEDDAER